MIGSRHCFPLALAIATATALAGRSGYAAAAGPSLKLGATVVAAPNAAPLSIELERWSTDAERAPLVAAWSAPAPAPVAAAPAPAAAGRAGRAGRGAARGGNATPPSPTARLITAVKAAPTVGYVWTSGITGYSIKYAWHAPGAGGGDRIVLVTDRRLGASSPGWPSTNGATDAEFTVLELRLDVRGAGEARSSLNSAVIVDEAAKTLALGDGIPLLKVTR